MRSYRRNSPEAAGRIVALALLADGHACRSEFDALADAGAEKRLGLAPGGLSVLLRTLCEDLVVATGGASIAAVDAATLDAILDEVDNPVLQGEVAALLDVVTMADDHRAHGENAISTAARDRWRPMPSRREALAA